MRYLINVNILILLVLMTIGVQLCDGAESSLWSQGFIYNAEEKAHLFVLVKDINDNPAAGPFFIKPQNIVILSLRKGTYFVEFFEIEVQVNDSKEGYRRRRERRVLKEINSNDFEIEVCFCDDSEN